MKNISTLASSAILATAVAAGAAFTAFADGRLALGNSKPGGIMILVR